MAPEIDAPLGYRMLYPGAYISTSSIRFKGTLSARPSRRTYRSSDDQRRTIKMANKCALVVLVLSLVISTVLCQTFQYSRGWTNGKRSEFPSSSDVSNPRDERFANGELKKLKMLVYENADEHPQLIHCDFVDKLRKLVHTDNYASQLRREHEPNNDNY